MLAITNHTPYEVALFPGLHRDGYDEATVLAKATFDLSRGAPQVAGEQVEVRHGEAFHGEPGRSSVRHECDTSPAKPGTDVVLLGHAHAPRLATVLDVGLAVGRLRKTVRVFGDRTWRRTLGGWEPSSPAPFEKMPLLWERAFGGSDTTDPDPARHTFELRNPVGTGFCGRRDEAHLASLALPNLEAPNALMTSPGDTPAPAGFGFLARSWQPRAALAGTYDERWRAERCPLLPLDFDERHHSAAPADQIARPHLRGGEPVVVTGASPRGELRFELPVLEIGVEVKVRGRTEAHRAALDTVVIEPDEGRLVLSYRTTFRCARQFLYIDRVTVTAGGRA